MADLDLSGWSKTTQVSGETLRQTAQAGWAGLFISPAKDRRYAATIALGDIAEIVDGVSGHQVTLRQLRSSGLSTGHDVGNGKAVPTGSIAAILSRNVIPFGITDIRFSVKSSAFKAPLRTEGRRNECIAVREFVDRRGTLTAAPLPSAAVHMSGLYLIRSVLADSLLLCAILNSSVVADWIAAKTGATINPAFRTLTIGDLRHVPVPLSVVALGVGKPAGMGKRPVQLRLQAEIVRQAGLISRSAQTGGDRSARLSRVDELVSELYAVSEEM